MNVTRDGAGRPDRRTDRARRDRGRAHRRTGRCRRPSPGWTIADQIGHLTYFDGTAATRDHRPRGVHGDGHDAARRDGDRSRRPGPIRRSTTPGRWTPLELLEAWRVEPDRARRGGVDTGRRRPGRLVRTVDGRQVVPHRSADGGVGPRPGHRRHRRRRARPATDRLQHIAQLGFITRGWSYVNRGLDGPRRRGPRRADGTVRRASGGSAPTTPTESVVGPAEDFCLVVTQRRHVDDTALVRDGRRRPRLDAQGPGVRRRRHRRPPRP